MNTDSNNDTALLPWRRKGSFQNRSSVRWSHLLLLLILSLCLVFPTNNAEAFKFPSLEIPHPDDVSKCGGNGQRACHAWEAVPTCDSGLAQNHVKQTCGKDVVGEWVETAVADSTDFILNSGESVAKFSEEQGKKAVDEAKKGVEAAVKAAEGAAMEVYKVAAELYYDQIDTPFVGMVQAWKDASNRNPQGFSALRSAIEDGDGPAIQAALNLVLLEMVETSNFALLAEDLQDADAGSFLFIVSAGLDSFVASAEVDLGVAIDIDYLIHVATTGKTTGFQGPILSLYTAAGLQFGPAAGGGIDVSLGYHIMNPNGVNGPSLDLSLELKAKVGGGVGVGFDLTKAPWQANTAAIGLGSGLELKAAMGPSYAILLGQLCGTGNFVALARECPSSEADTLPVNPAIDQVDAAVSYYGYTYLFQGGKYFQINRYTVDSNYPKHLHGRWVGFPSQWTSVDAAYFDDSNQKLYMFRGDEYVRLTDYTVDPGYPIKISAGFSGLPTTFLTGLDAAIRQGGYLYFFKNGQYVKLSEGSVMQGYPTNLPSGWDFPESFKGGISAATSFEHQADTNYIFKGNQYVNLKGVNLTKGPTTLPGGWEGFTLAPSKYTASLRNVQTNQCLHGENDAVNVVQGFCDNSVNQRVVFTRVPGKPDVHTIQFQHTGKCLDVLQSDSTYLNVSQKVCHDGANQQFKLEGTRYIDGNLDTTAYALIPQHETVRNRLATPSGQSGGNSVLTERDSSSAINALWYEER